MRWITDFLVRTAISFFSGRNQQFNHEALLYVGSLLVRRAVFVAVGALASVVLAIGGLFMVLVDLGNYLNAFGSMGLTYSGGVGLVLLAVSLFSLFLVYRSPVKIKAHELEMLRSSQQESMGEVILAGLMEKLQAHLQPQAPVPPQATGHAPTVPSQQTQNMAPHVSPSFRPTGSMDPSGVGLHTSKDAREWSAYTN